MNNSERACFEKPPSGREGLPAKRGSACCQPQAMARLRVQTQIATLHKNVTIRILLDHTSKALKRKGLTNHESTLTPIDSARLS